MKNISNHSAIIILFFIFAITVNKMLGQEIAVLPEFHSYYYSPQNLGISTPNVSDFIKYGNLSTNLYNGLLDFEIPIDEYDDKDFDLCMSLKYISNGFVPAKRPSFVGNNWILNYGGVITRSVMGSPDDNKGKYKNSDVIDYIVDGILVPIKNNTFVQYSEADLMHFKMAENTGGNNTPYMRGDFKHDFEPDIFRFSFGKHSGSFIIGNQGIPISLCGQGYKIDISGISIQEYNTSSAPISSSITITTPDGYIYNFGGNTNYLEYCIPNNPDKAVKIMPRFITAWYLKSIRSPNGREVNFNYLSVLQKNKYNSFVYAYNEFFIKNAGGGTDCDVINPYSTALTAKKLIMEDNIYTPVIKKIIVDNGTEIEFDINLNSVGFYDTNDYSLYLSSIKYKYNSNIIKSILFSYKYSGNYFFLDSVFLKDKIYKFEYNLNTILPNPLTISTDHWGFWNGGYDVSLTESGASSVANYCYNIDTKKQVNTNVCNVGLLKRITYPTGGITEIFYEHNRYRKYLTRSMNEVSLAIDSVAESIPCGGARVQKLRDYDHISQQYFNERTYMYKNYETNKESGIIGVVPKYRTQEKVTYYRMEPKWTNNQSINCNYLIENTVTDISSNSYSTNDILEEYHVGYSDVIENYTDNSCLVSHFSSFNDVPNGEDITYESKLMSAVSTLNTIAQIEKIGLYKTNDMSSFRGKLLSEKTYNSSGCLVLQKYNTYNIHLAKSKYNISVRSVARGRSSYKIYLIPCLLTCQNIIDKNNVQQQVIYQYNSNNLLSSTSVLGSDGKKQTTKLVYPFEITEGADTAVLRKMTTKNMLDNYVEKVSYLENGKVIDAEYCKFNETAANSGIFKPEKIYLLPKTGSSTLGSLYPINYHNAYVMLATDVVPSDVGGVETSFIVKKNTSKIKIESHFQQAPDYGNNIMPRYFMMTIKDSNGNVCYSMEGTGTVYGSFNTSGYYNYDRIDSIELQPGTYTLKLTHTSRIYSDYDIYHNGYSIVSFNEKTTDMSSSYSQFKPEISYKYDSKGNIIEAKHEGNQISTVYLWGYKHQYPIAEIKNATYDEAKTALNYSSDSQRETLAAKAEPTSSDWSLINNLRTKLPNAQVTVYKYMPLVGRLSATNPSGNTVYYEYDALNRLKFIKDNDNNILQRYDYNYKQ
ncbi:MAG: hypothetical protein LBJ63_05540 [Prevotellaceae bacterium]|jgi:YD repeat-containing protein|nr:hypothetical protein [Prevotellaceae bacterium]